MAGLLPGATSSLTHEKSTAASTWRRMPDFRLTPLRQRAKIGAVPEPRG